MKNIKKYTHKLILLTLFIFGLYILLYGVKTFVGNELDNGWTRFVTTIENVIYREILETHLLGIQYTMEEKKEEETFGKYVIGKVMNVLPIYGFTKDLPEYETEIEAGITYEMLIAKEGVDEDYKEEMIAKEQEGENIGQEENPVKEEVVKVEEPVVDPVPEAVVSPEQEAQSTQGSTILGSATPLVEYSLEKLNDFDYLMQKFYTVDKTTTINGEQLKADEMLGKDMTMKTDVSLPQILIYHTHSQETFVDSIPGDPGTSIVGVGVYLTTLLRDTYGFNVIHHQGQYDLEGRNYAYNNALPEIAAILEANPSIEVVIDLHRDGVAESTHLVTEVNGKQTAKFMFFNGLSRTTQNGDISYLPNPYIQENLAFSFQLKLKAAQYYPEVTRSSYLKSLRYNLHLRQKSLLVEMGAQTNTFEEVKNAAEPLADVLNKVLRGL